MNIVPKLNLNKHAKDSENLSLVNGLNMKLSHDLSCLTSEESIKENTFIHNYLLNYYGNLITYKIVGLIACNNEIVIIVKPSDTELDSDIFRYQEPINDNIEDMSVVYGGISSINRFKYHGGSIKGTFTYNVENSLIVAISEYGVVGIKIPLRTINLGNYADPTVYNDKNISDAKLATSPELKVPTVSNLDYVEGSAYKGWYYVFLRYKINSVDYTQWHSIGFPIYIDTIEHFQIIRYCYNRDTHFIGGPLPAIVYPPHPDDGYGAGCSDYFSNTSEIAKETFKVDMTFDASIDYDKYQVGVVCTSKSYNKAFRTSDIILSAAGTSRTVEFILDNKSLVEATTGEFIIDNFNYFNSKNVINYQNKLYISNYTEDNANNDDILQSKIDDIDVSLSYDNIRDYGLVYDTALMNGRHDNSPNQYDTYRIIEIPMPTYLNVSESQLITIEATGSPTKTVPAGQVYIMTTGSLPDFIYIEVREPGPLGSVTLTKYSTTPTSPPTYLTVVNNINYVDTRMLLNQNDLAMNGGMRYINANRNYKDRKENSTLIPGEVYNFFIHFVNKYNHATNGYKLINKTKWATYDDLLTEIIPVPFNVKISGTNVTYYAAVPVDNNVSYFDLSSNEYVINTENVRYYRSYTENSGVNPQLLDRVELINEDDIRKVFVDNFSSYTSDKFDTIKWYQVSYGPGYQSFHLFINNNGERLFKIPTAETFLFNYDGFPGELTPFKTYNTHVINRIIASNVEIPEGYDGFYISYEKFEAQQRVTGLLTRNDFRNQDYINGVYHETANDFKSDKMFFYSGQYDIADTIKLDYNVMRIEAVNPYKRDDMPEWDYMQRNAYFSFLHDMNKPQVDRHFDTINRVYPMPQYKIAVADSAVDNRMALGTGLEIKDSYNLFPNYYVSNDAAANNKIKLYRVTLLNTTRDIYMSNSKTLIRMSETIYRSEGSPIDTKYSTGVILNGYNGHHTYDGFGIYSNRGLIFNTANNIAKKFNNSTDYYMGAVPASSPHTWQNDYPFYAYVQMPICTDIFYESKSYKNEPKPIAFLVKLLNEQQFFSKGQMVTPANTIDLFENKQGSADQFNPKTYTQFRDDLVSIEVFDKTLRRSAVIQDESRINGWRTFPVEAYKNITENKGKITNLVGIGYILLVHTEHSLFQFNTDATLKTKDQDIQLLQPDAFDVQYKEVFTSDKGFGGLQDDKSYLIDTFGYMFYSNDTKRIYIFDDGKLDFADEDIIHWLDKYAPFNVRMANDKFNYRILFKFDYIINTETKHTVISYSYKTKSFINQHSYYFDEAFNTKTGLYLQCTNEHVGCSLHSFNYNKADYCRYDNILGSLGTSVRKESKLSIICNNNFDIVKFLEFISYKLTKHIFDANIDYTHLPVEGTVQPYAGSVLSVYNDQVNTNPLDIAVNTELDKNPFGAFDKPYWDLGVWNFSYLRNNISNLPNGVSASEMSRIFGNYFIIEFTFDNIDNRRIDFEQLNYNLSEL